MRLGPHLEITLADPALVTPLNKNTLKKGRGGRLYKTPERQHSELSIESAVRSATEALGLEWHKTKTWLRIKVTRPSTRQDAINYLDAVADSVQRGIGVNDKWFAVAGLDWEIGADYALEIEVWQDGDFDEEFCARCQKILPMTAFRLAKKSGERYLSRCAACDSQYNKDRRAARRATAIRIEGAVTKGAE